MTKTILARLLTTIPTLFVILTLSFFLMRMAPGGPFDQERALDPEILQNLRRIYRLDLPLYQQYFLYMANLLQGDLGPSFHWRDFTVNALFARALPISLQLGAEALLVSILVGFWLGVMAAVQRRGFSARLVGLLSFAGLAIPTFVIAPLLQVVFGLILHQLPVGGWGDGSLKYQILPVITLALPQTAILARLVETAMIEELSAPHIKTLRAFGMPAGVINLHALRTACLPAISYLGPAAANLLTGSIVVETIFGIPGIGRYFVDGALNRDYTLVMGTVIVVAVLVILLNLIVDLLYALLDPRVRDDG
jgi:oligopeptide transport system permease protein